MNHRADTELLQSILYDVARQMAHNEQMPDRCAVAWYERDAKSRVIQSAHVLESELASCIVPPIQSF
jgi:hypothetical protein